MIFLVSGIIFFGKFVCEGLPIFLFKFYISRQVKNDFKPHIKIQDSKHRYCPNNNSGFSD